MLYALLASNVHRHTAAI